MSVICILKLHFDMANNLMGGPVAGIKIPR